jgi:hypothetical protein
VTATADSVRPNFDELLRRVRTNQGRSLLEHSQAGDLLTVFLRHAGCTFCRETLADLRRLRPRLDAQRVTPCLIHMGDDAAAAAFFAAYGMDDVPRISDPERTLYRAIGLQRGTLAQLIGPYVWWRGIQALLGGHGVGAPRGDGLQLPGAFVLRDGRIAAAYRHRTAGDRPDYLALACQAR